MAKTTVSEQIAAAKVAIDKLREENRALNEIVVACIEKHSIVSVENLDQLAKVSARYGIACALHTLITVRSIPRFAEWTDEEVVSYVIDVFKREDDLGVHVFSSDLEGAALIAYRASHEAMLNVESFFTEAKEGTLIF